MRDYDEVIIDVEVIDGCGLRRAFLFDGARAVESAPLDGRATVRGDACANAAASPPELLTVRASLRARARYFERPVLAWYALGRVQERARRGRRCARRVVAGSKWSSTRRPQYPPLTPSCGGMMRARLFVLVASLAAMLLGAVLALAPVPQHPIGQVN
jgi:hypothetical protein